MSQSKMITGKFSRTLKTTGITASSGIRHLSYLGAKKFSNDPEALKKKNEEDIGKIIFKGLSQMRGTALKVSQLISMEADFLPEGIRKELAKSCHQVPAINKALVRKAVVTELGAAPKDIFIDFDSEAFAAASLGQVHRAKLASGEEVAVKIQYPGIRESIENDLEIITFVVEHAVRLTNSDAVPKNGMLELALNEIGNALQNETDYEKEADNTQWFLENLKVKSVRIPKTYSQYTSKKILTTEILQGLHADEWLAGNPSQEQRNHSGQVIFNIFLYSAFELNMIHADPHMGNYLFLKSGDIGLIDFGCVRRIDKDFAESIAALMTGLIKNNTKETLLAYKSLSILPEDMTDKEYETMVRPGLRAQQERMISPFRSERFFDFAKLPASPRMETQEHKDAIAKFTGFERDHMYFDRMYTGVYSLLKKIGAVVDTKNTWVEVT